MDVTGPEIHAARFDDLDVATLHDLLALRSEVFIVEQQCTYLDIDGRDSEPATVHMWIEADGAIAATLRVLTEPDGAIRIGRVCTRPSARGRGYAAQLVRAAAADLDVDAVLAAQSHLRGWYEQFGFVVDGPEFDDVGITHVPMRRTGRRSRSE